MVDCPTREGSSGRRRSTRAWGVRTVFCTREATINFILKNKKWLFIKINISLLVIL